MDFLRVDILNPKAEKLLQELEGLRLISIRKSKRGASFSKFLKRQRKKENAVALDAITREVETVRAKRYEKG